MSAAATDRAVSFDAVKGVYLELGERIADLDVSIAVDADPEWVAAWRNVRAGYRNAQVMVGRVLGVES